MRKMIAMLFIGAISFSLAYADTARDDSTMQDLSGLRKKLSRMKREMDLLIKDIVSSAPAISDSALKDLGEDVRVDILQNEKDVLVTVDLPGMEKDKINITLEGNRFLKISGSREMVKNQTTPNIVRQERFYGSFEKAIELPCEVENTGINAVYKNGVLEITILKKTVAKEEKVKIKVN